MPITPTARPRRPNRSTLETDGLQFLKHLAAGTVKPDTALKQSWIDDVTAVAHGLGLSDRALARQFSAGRSLAQIAASRGVPTSIPRNVLLSHLRDDLHRAERDHAPHRRPRAPCLTPSARNSAGPSLPVMTHTKCPGCGAVVPDTAGPVHKYVPSAPGCWQTFGEVQADEAQRFRYPPAHRMVVDAYMAQHPGDGGDRRDRQSVFVHLVGLCAVLEHGLAHPYVTKLLGQVLRRRQGDFPSLARGGPGPLTVLHMIGTADLCDYERRAREWSIAVWKSWNAQHTLIQTELDAVRNNTRP